jgi:hypothetical protein
VVLSFAHIPGGVGHPPLPHGDVSMTWGGDHSPACARSLPVDFTATAAASSGMYRTCQLNLHPKHPSGGARNAPAPVPARVQRMVPLAALSWNSQRVDVLALLLEKMQSGDSAAETTTGDDWRLVHSVQSPAITGASCAKNSRATAGTMLKPYEEEEA